MKPCKRALLMLHDTQIQVAGDANVKRACMAAENVDIAAGHSKDASKSLVLDPQKYRGGSARLRGALVEKLRTAWLK